MYDMREGLIALEHVDLLIPRPCALFQVTQALSQSTLA